MNKKTKVVWITGASSGIGAELAIQYSNLGVKLILSSRRAEVLGQVKSNCFIINKKLAYISDVSKIYEKDFKNFRNLDYLIIDCLLYKSHPSHFSLENALSMVEKFKPKKGILTNLSPSIDYKILKNRLPKKVIAAYDGLTIKL